MSKKRRRKSKNKLRPTSTIKRITNYGDFNDVYNRIDNLVKDLAKEIQKCDPLSILRRAFWSHAFLHIHPAITPKPETDQVISLRILEFTQNYIASLEPAKTILSVIDESRWVRIEKLVRDINDLMIPYFIFRTANLKNQSGNYDFEKDALFTQDSMHWWAVRGNRHTAHEIIHAQELLSPFNNIFQELFGIQVDGFIREIEKIQHSLTFGIGDAFNDLVSFRDESLERIKDLDFAKLPRIKGDTTLLREAIESVGLRNKADEIFERAFGLAICNLNKITNLPVELLEDLSWREGQDKDFWSFGEYAGWPLRVTPLRKRPFLNIQGQYYCFDLHNLFDNLYRVIERLVLAKKPEYRETWNKIQKENSETLPFKYLETLLPNAKVYRSVYYGKLGTRTEVDGLIIYDDVLLIVEVKAGALDANSPVLDYDTHLKKLKELISNPATQAIRFRESLESNSQITIFDGNGKQSKTLDILTYNEFRKIFQCTVTLDNLSHMAAKASKLKPLGIDIHTPANWSVALDDLRVYTDIFDSPLQFLHFLEQRELAETSELIELNDELDHLGIYLQKNNYYLTAKEMMTGKKPTKVIWDSFTQEIDEYFSKVLEEPNKQHAKPSQKMPSCIKEIIKVLETQGKPQRARAASHLLNGSGEYRQQIEDGINYVLKRQKLVSRLNPFHIHGDMNVSVFCEHEGVQLPEISWIKDYIISMLIEYKKDQTLVLFLRYNRKDILVNVDFDFISIADMNLAELNRIKQETSKIKDRLSRYKLDARKLRK